MSEIMAGLPAQVEKLLGQREMHAHAIVSIDQTLSKVNAALGLTTAVALLAKPVALKMPKLAAPKTAMAKVASAPVARKRRRSKFAVSGSESVLAFVKAKKNPTTQEIKKHWTGEGRAGGVDNTLSILTKEKKLKRTPLGKGIRGSRYAIA